MNISWKTCFRVGVSALLLVLCVKYSDAALGGLKLLVGAVSPILLGLVLAYILNLPMSFYERHYFTKQKKKAWVGISRRPVCIVAALLTLCAIIALVVGLVMPELVECVKFIIAEIPPLIERMLESDTARAIMPDGVAAELEKIDWGSLVDSAINVIKSGIGSAFNTVVDLVSSVFSGIVTAFICIIFAVYVLANKETLLAQTQRLMKNYLRPAWLEKTRQLLSLLNSSFHKYIVGQCTEAVILGVLCMLGMLIFQFPYAAMIGALVAFMALIPVAGAFIAAAVGALMILTVSPLKALLFVVFFVVLQQLEGNLIYPKVVGKSVGLPAMWVLAAITVGGTVMGIVGMLIAVPIASVVYRLISEDMAKRESVKKTGKTNL